MANILVGSLQYSPVYKSHCCGLGRQLELAGHQVHYIFNKRYEWMLSQDTKDKSTFISHSENPISSFKDGLSPLLTNYIYKLLSDINPSHIYLDNIHPFLNRHLAKWATKNNVVFIQHFQEPYVMNKSVYGRVYHYTLNMFEYLQEKLLKHTDIAVLSSNEALKLFNMRYPKFPGKTLQIPLMYEDLLSIEHDISRRRYLTFIGPPVPAKGPETFLNIVIYAEKENFDYEFILVSRFPVIDSSYKEHKNLRIIYKPQISDQEIGDYLSNSIASITPYKTARQSSVVLTSYMYGTPVLSTNVGGLKEVINHLTTGYILDPNADIREWNKGIQYIINNFNEITLNCRNYFINNHSEINWPRYFKEMIT